MTDDESTGYVRVVPVGMVPPGLVSTIQGGVEGVVREDGTLALDGVSGTHLRLQDTDVIDAGTEVYVKRKRGGEWCKPLREYKRDKRQREAERRLKEWKRDREKDQARDEAKEFWERYEIPFEYDVAIKGRRSGLLRGSSGTGRASNTVTHLFVQEAFSDGRLERPADVYLCNNEAKFEFDGERRTDSEGNTFIPEVTCQTCLERMKRWKTDQQHEATQ